MRKSDTNKTELVHYKLHYITKDWNGLEDDSQIQQQKWKLTAGDQQEGQEGYEILKWGEIVRTEGE